MLELPTKLTSAIESISRLPGVGTKTATRQVLSILNWSDEERNHYATSIQNLNSLIKCQTCGLISEEETCSICLSERRKETGVICVVESISDLYAIENSQEFKGQYHILGGVLNPLLGVGPEQLNIQKLVERCHSEKIKTLILAISPSIEGDATCSYLKHLLVDIRIQRIGFGIPMGGSLEYLDPMTISKALENRREFS